MEFLSEPSWPATAVDRHGHNIYMTFERWEHALGHPAMHDGLLDAVMDTIREGSRRPDKYMPAKFSYIHEFFDLPEPYTHVVVVVKMGWTDNPPGPNNFILTAYLTQKW